MARIPLVRADDPGVDPKAAAILKSVEGAQDVPVLNVHRALANHPDAMEAFFNLAGIVYFDNSLNLFYIRTADRLRRTAPWLEHLEGGVDYLRRVVLEDSLGICAELDAAWTGESPLWSRGDRRRCPGSRGPTGTSGGPSTTFSQANVLARGIVGSAGDRTYVASPMYKQRFDLRSGECLDDEGVSVAVWPARAQDGSSFRWSGGSTRPRRGPARRIGSPT